VAKRRPVKEPGIPEWVLTYGDLMSLLLCFFILLAAFSELKQPREYEKVIESIQEALGFRGGIGVARLDAQSKNSIISMFEEQAKRDQQRKNRDETTNENITGDSPSTSVVHEGNRISIGASIVFAPGEAGLTGDAQEFLRAEVAKQLVGQRFICIIAGHAWGFPDKAAADSLDQLAFARALAVKEFLVRECGVSDDILRVESASDREPVSLSGGTGESGGENRRVQIWMTGRTVEQTHPDPNHTGRGGP